jgi:hypothetical protein
VFELKGNDSGASEVVDATLIVVLGLALAGIVAAFIFGVFVPVEKTAYLVPQFGIVNVSDHSVIFVFDRGGDPVYLNTTPPGNYQGALYVDTQYGSFRAVPSSSLTVLKPGDTVYAFYTGSGFILTDTIAGATLGSLPAGPITVRFVDVTSGVVIAREDLVKGTTAPTATVPTTTTLTTTITATPTATSTATTTTTVTTTTTMTTTTTATPTPLPLAANFNWVESGSSGNVRFTDTSTGAPTSWSWNFGDGATSTAQNPTHRFTKGAFYDVVITVRRSTDGASSTTTKRVTL